MPTIDTSHPPSLASSDDSDSYSLASDDSSRSSISSSSSALYGSGAEFDPATSCDPDNSLPRLILRKPISRSTLNPAWREFFCDAFTPPPITPLSSIPLEIPDRSLPPPLHDVPNFPSGDHFGTPPPDTFRIWSNNVKGLSAANGFATLHELCLTLQHHDVSVLAFQETNLDFTQHWMREAIHDILKEHFGNARLVTATSCIPAPNSWKPGGVALAVLGPWADAIVRTESDDLGRWCTATFSGSDNSSFTILNAYNCVKTTLKQSGRGTVFAQQWRLLRLSGILHPNPRQQFITDLMADLKQRRSNGETLLLVGDFNERLGDDPKLMASIATSFCLADPHSSSHGSASDVPTYIRGQKRLDYCLLDVPLLDHVTACGINLFNEIYHSDHRALFIDLSLRLFLRARLPPVSPADFRFISTRSPDVSKFVNAVHDHLTHNNAFEQFDDFSASVSTASKPWEKANKIDEILGQAFTTAERKCYKRPRPAWSEKLYLASLQVRYWRTALTARRTGVDHTLILSELAALIWSPDPTPPSPRNLRALQSRTRAAECALRRIRLVALAERKIFLEDLRERIALRTKTSQTTREAALQNVTRQLQDTKRFSRIKRALDPVRPTQLTKVEVVYESSHLHPVTGKTVTIRKVETVDTRRALEKCIIDRNQRHFAQALGTPFTRRPFSYIGSANNFNVYNDADGNPIEVPDDCFVETHTILDILKDHAAHPPPHGHLRWTLTHLSLPSFTGGNRLLLPRVADTSVCTRPLLRLISTPATNFMTLLPTLHMLLPPKQKPRLFFV